MNHSLLLSRDGARELDRRAIEELGVPGIVLMENAGRAIVDYLLSCGVTGKIIICCGKGNNAGDGFVVARYLDNLDLPVHILLFANPEVLTGDAKINYDIAVKTSLPITIINDKNLPTAIHEKLSNAEWIIDAIFGTGLQGSVREPYYTIIQAINDSKAKILSVDIPSGLDCDTGEPLGIAISATHTVTFVGNKKGFLNPSAKKFLGHVHVANIGTPKILLRETNI